MLIRFCFLHIGLSHEVSSSNKGILESHILLACWYFSFCCCVALFHFMLFSCFVLLSQSRFWDIAAVFMVAATGLWSERMNWCNISMLLIESWADFDEIKIVAPFTSMRSLFDAGYTRAVTRAAESVVKYPTPAPTFPKFPTPDSGFLIFRTPTP